MNTGYTLRGQILEVVTSARYLGVDISDSISWNFHIDVLLEMRIELWVTYREI